MKKIYPSSKKQKEPFKLGFKEVLDFIYRITSRISLKVFNLESISQI